jgi:hypothetical protein
MGLERIPTRNPSLCKYCQKKCTRHYTFNDNNDNHIFNVFHFILKNSIDGVVKLFNLFVFSFAKLGFLRLCGGAVGLLCFSY